MIIEATDFMPIVAEPLKRQIFFLGGQFRAYVFSNYNIIEWVYTVRLLICGTLLFFNRKNGLDPKIFSPFEGHTVGALLLLLGIFGLFVSRQLVVNYWANVIFAVSVFSFSVVMASMFITHGVFDEPLFYIHLSDIAASGWLIKRVMIERFLEQHATRFHGNYS